MRASAITFCSALLLGAVLGSGATPALADGSDFAVRARPGGLDFLGDTVAELVPTRFDIPDVDGDLIAVTNGVVDLQVVDLTIAPLAGMLEVGVILDVDATADLDAGFTDCEVAVTAMPVIATGELTVGVGADGRVTAQDLGLEVGLDPDQFELDIEGCVLGDVFEAVFDAAEAWALDKITELVAEQAGDMILPMVQQQLEAFLDLELEAAGFRVAGTIANVSIEPSTGLTATIAADIEWAGPVSPDVVDRRPPAVEQPLGDALPASYGPADFALAAGDDRVTLALFEAWRGGMFTAILDGLAPSLELSDDGLAQKLGLPGGTTVDLAIHLDSPPVARFGRAAAGSVTVDLDDVRVAATIGVPGAEPAILEVEVDGVADAAIGIDPAGGALRLALGTLAIERVEITGGSQVIDVDPARLEGFVQAVVVPMLEERLAGVAIAPALQPADGIFVLARDVATEDGWVRVAADMFRADPDDETAPDTRLIDPPTAVSPALAGFAVTGSDDTTPPELLRYRVRLDGEDVTEEPDFATSVAVPTEGGAHLLEVFAVDLTGNVDPTPAVHSFYVDGVPPELELVDAPEEISSRDPGRAAWTVSDDRTPDAEVTTSWTLVKMVDGLEETVASEDFAAGRTEVALPVLDSDSLYVLTVVARDDVGNVTSVVHAFAVEPGGSGCSATGAGGAGTGLAVALAVLLLGLVVRRRRAAAAAAAIAVAAVVVAVAPAAHAQGVGTTLSGPTDADGAASFWNPAAMSLGTGTRVDVGSALSLIRVEYQPMESDVESNTFVPKPEPTLGAFSDLGGLHEDLRVGFTVAIPQIDGASWSRDDGASDVTRWYTVEGKSYHVTITPSVSYRPASWIAIGAGLDIVRSTISAELDKDMGKSLNQAAGSPIYDSPFPYADPAFAAPVSLEAEGWSVGAVAGVMLRPHRRITVGASVHTPTTTDARGDIDVVYPEAVAGFIDDSVPAADLPPLYAPMSVELGKPLMTFAAIAVEPADRWEIRADYRFIDRSSAGDLLIDVDEEMATSEDVSDTRVVRGYRDRHSIGVRASHRMRRGLVAVRGRYEPSSVPESTMAPNNIDFDKYEVGLAGEVALGRGVSLVAHYSHFFIPSRTVETSLHQPYTEPELDSYNHPAPTGTYGAVSDYVAVLLSMQM